MEKYKKPQGKALAWAKSACNYKADGRITDFGKYENEVLLTPYFDFFAKDGFGDWWEQDGVVGIQFPIEKDDIETFSEFPELCEILKNNKYYSIVETKSGFVTGFSHCTDLTVDE